MAEFVASQQSGGRPRPDAEQQRGHARTLEARQNKFRRQLERIGVEIQSQMRASTNGISVRANPDQIQKIRNMAGVASIHSIEQHTPLNADSVPWIGAPEVWSNPGATGSGVVIGVIDTGIDYFHAGMGGSGDPADFAENDPSEADPAFFPNDKVIGGWDFVGTDFTGGATPPMPDNDPVDENFHGTHVSGSAAGLATDSVGSGVAPDASLYALKVFGATGSTNQTANAIERSLDPNQDGSIDDALDVINMSLGSNFGDPDSLSSLASQAAAEAGVIVVSSAGNAGEVPYILGSPAIAPDAIAVAASFPGGRFTPLLTVTAPADAAGEFSGVEGAGPVLLEETGPISGQLVPGEPLEGCEALDNAAEVDGNIALIIRGTCAFDTKYLNAQDAGAAAIVVYNDGTAPNRVEPITMGGLSDAITIPGAMISFTVGDQLDRAAAMDPVQATLGLGPNDEFADTIVGFSSRGPGAGGSSFKPDVSAPGESITSHGFGTGTGGITASGTSMAAPHVAGMAAIMRELHPDLAPTAIKAMIMNSTETAYEDGVAGASVPFPITAQGTGVIRVDRAAKLSSYAMPAGVSFGRVNPDSDASITRNIRLHNLSGETRTFTAEHVVGQNPAGVEVRLLEEGPIELGPHGRTTVPVQLRLDPAQMSADPGFFSQREADGWFIFEDGVDTLRVAYMAAVDPASRITLRSGRRGMTAVRNSGVSEGIAQGFTLAGAGDKASSDGHTAIDAFGFRTIDDRVDFGLATQQPWETMSAVAVFIDIDHDFDGAPDLTLVAADFGALTGGAEDGRVVTGVLGGDLQFFADADINDRVAVLPFLRDSFLPPDQTAFNYSVEVLDRRNGMSGTSSGSIDLVNEVALSQPALLLAPRESQRIEVSAPGELLWLLPNDEDRSQARTQRVR
ncbi:MAG: S8 family serine peptidase [Wenzhouxiangellaceae bacterium]|nr:S8 family serine peptidase [Wenzhouxiangellaceae bacterium]